MTNAVIDGTAATSEPAVPAKKPRVLLADPDNHVRAMTAELLQDAGMTVCGVDGCEAALSAMDARWSPTVVVTEYRLETGVHGLTLARLVHQRDVRMPAIVYTSNTNLTPEHARRASAYALVLKGEPFERLTDTIHSAHASYSDRHPE